MPPPLNAIDPRLRTLRLGTALFSIMVVFHASLSLSEHIHPQLRTN
jgi:hypothetical protein